MHDGMPYGRNQGQGQGHSREVDRQSPTGLIFIIKNYYYYYYHHHHHHHLLFIIISVHCSICMFYVF